MTRAERILELDILLQQLRAEQQMEDWLKAHPAASEVLVHDHQGKPMIAVWLNNEVIAVSEGADIADARGQVFSTIFTNEAASSGA